MKRRLNKYRLSELSALIIRLVLCLCILEGCLIAVYIRGAAEFGAILERKVTVMLEHVCAALMLGVGGALLIDRLIKNKNT